MSKGITAKEVLQLDVKRDAPILGFGIFDTHPDHLCFVAQNDEERRFAVFFQASDGRVAQMCAALMEHAGVRQVSIKRDGRLTWQVGPIGPAQKKTRKKKP